MEYVVRKGYVVIDYARRYEAGEKIPASIFERIAKEQNWKIEPIPVKEKEVKENKETKEKLEGVKTKEVKEKDK